ncbi:pyocin knob domain-containing protein [Pseudoflavonifractor phocaeensis]|uniref:pyocin knob domain-containing protein n=1 Tax=Pseudoflavonifractor phocaeensis TaxID=1870988 RepID=UPI001957016D|nr:pyocin knob domain-containing protein [Pseudoflavonifractor phocaeensis]MBM6887871.1 hypothetical protein [Pseudoflavonifractor phocaeensis]
MAENPITVPLPQDLPETWETNQIVSPDGVSAGLTPQHGYNYLMQQVNNAQQAAQELGEGIAGLSGDNLPASSDGGETISMALSNKVDQFIELGPEDDLNTIMASGFYRLNGTAINVPAGCSFGVMIVCGDETNTIMQIVSNHTNTALYKRTWRNASIWSEWLPIPTATPPQEFNLPLASGWSALPGGLATYFKTQESVVCLTLNVGSSTPVSQGNLIATLPEGYRPSAQIKVPIVYLVSGQSVYSIGHLDVGSDGTIVIYNSQSGNEVISEISSGTVVFIAT